MSDKLNNHKKTWENKKIIRVLYKEWYNIIISDLNLTPGKTIELGAGTGNFKEFKPDVISSDIEYCSWLDMCFDAHDMPFNDFEIENIVMIDVFHHLSNPIKFLNEAFRILNNKGRIIILEPFPSLFSLIVYKIFHPEPFMFSIDYFNMEEVNKKNPWDSNQAIAYLIFYKELKKFNKYFHDKFRIIIKKKLSCILYPLSGGFEKRQLIPDLLIPFFKFLEYILIPFRFLLAFRCYIVIEKT